VEVNDSPLKKSGRKLVKYCSDKFQKCSPQHKKGRKQHVINETAEITTPLTEKQAAEKRAAKEHEEALFKEHPFPEECPICLIPIPGEGHAIFEACCGKIICNGCIYAMKMSEGAKDMCAFCRTPTISSDKEVESLNKLMEKGGHAYAANVLGCYYKGGLNGMPKDDQKAKELWLKAGELGCASGYYNLGRLYGIDNGIESENVRGMYYYELAAINGSLGARFELGAIEGQTFNESRAIKHHTIAAKAGHKPSMNILKRLFRYGDIIEDELEDTLRAYQERLEAMKSQQREEAEEYHAANDPDRKYKEMVQSIMQGPDEDEWMEAMRAIEEKRNQIS